LNDALQIYLGDSGGGIVEVINGSYYLRGIASVTLTDVNGRCNVENPVGFTNVESFINWIKARIY
jgi:secreted trypsin-like serine protease